jgi:hypothetical protein
MAAQALAVGALAVGALAVGALAVGALAVGALPRCCWRGELPLAVTYWLWGGGNVGFALLLWPSVRQVRCGESGGMRPWPVCWASLVRFIFAFGAIWRSAGRYHGPPLRKWLARAGVMSGIARMAIELALAAAAEDIHSPP